MKRRNYNLRLGYLVNALCMFLTSCGVSYDWDSKSGHSVNIDSLSVEERLYSICGVSFSSNEIILTEWYISDVVVVSFCYGNDTINVASYSNDIYKKVNMSILDEETFQKSLYAHISSNIPIEVDSTFFAKFNQYKITPCLEVTELYKKKGIGAVLWHYMKGKRYMPDWPMHFEEDDSIQIKKKKARLNLIRNVIYLAFKHHIFFNFGEELTYWVDDKGFELMEKFRLEELAKKMEKESVKPRNDSIK